ncbi:MAG: UPF0280 family protein [Methanomassiliicoccales archaeon]|jgi:ApbE superfamily uncharacterized protein (UPF0280 family)|nr:UPF0280 family protein [Methanomassiliicoccales archaeon]
MVTKKHFEIGETAVNIIAEERFIPAAEASIFNSREQIIRFALSDPFFLVTLEPYEPPSSAPPIVRRMCEVSRRAGVGPMAAVAGIIAEEAVRAMVAEGADHAIVDNGGDIAMKLKVPVEIGIYAGDHYKGKIGFRCEPREGIFGICTSSGKVGHSISFGISDAATVVAEDVALADACATLLGNLIKSDDEEIVRAALDKVCSINGVEGTMVIVGDKVALKGKLPRLIRTDFSEKAISRIEFAFN